MAIEKTEPKKKATPKKTTAKEAKKTVKTSAKKVTKKKNKYRKKPNSNKNETGRPIEIDREILVAKLEESASWGCSFTEMALHADVSRQYMYVLFNEMEGLKDRLDALRDNPTLAARKRVAEELPRNTNLAWDYLQKKQYKEFRAGADTTSDGKRFEFVRVKPKEAEEPETPDDGGTE